MFTKKLITKIFIHLSRISTELSSANLTFFKRINLYFFSSLLLCLWWAMTFSSFFSSSSHFFLLCVLRFLDILLCTASFFLIKSIKHKSTLSLAYNFKVYLVFIQKEREREIERRKDEKQEEDASVFKPISDMHRRRQRRRQWILKIFYIRIRRVFMKLKKKYKISLSSSSVAVLFFLSWRPSLCRSFAFSSLLSLLLFLSQCCS